MAIPPGVEPGPSARQADIIAVRPWDQKFRFVCLAAQSPIALAEFRLGVHPLRTRIRLLGSCQNGTGLWIGCVGRTRTSDLQLMRLARWPLLYLAISVCHYSFVLASSLVQAERIERSIPQGDPDLQSGAIPLRRRLHNLGESQGVDPSSRRSQRYSKPFAEPSAGLSITGG